MFGTFRYNRNTNDHEHIEISRADGLEARGFTRVACKSCRDRKLKCSGDKTGCKRCRAMSQKCIYKSSPPSSMALPSASSLNTPERSTEQTSSILRPAGPKSPDRPTSSTAAPLVSAPSSNSAGICSLLPAMGLSSGCLFDESGDPDVYAADPSLFTLNSGASVMQGPSADMEPDDDSNSAGSFESNRRRGDYTNWSLHSARMTLSLGLDDAATSMASQDNQDHNAELNLLLMPDTQPPRSHQSNAQQVEDHTWDLNIDLGSADSVNQCLLSETHSEQSGLNTDSDTDMALSTTMMQPSPGAISGSNSPYSKTSKGRPEFIKPTNSRGTCQCLHIMAQALQRIDAQGAGDTKQGGIDVLVISLGQGMETLEEVLACEQCNACVENGIIIATLAQQLTCVSESAAIRLIAHSRQLERATRSPHSGDSIDMAGEEVLDGEITFGRCKIRVPKMRLSLVRHAVMLHVVELRALLGRTKKLMIRSRGAWKLLNEIEAKVVKIREALR